MKRKLFSVLLISSFILGGCTAPWQKAPEPEPVEEVEATPTPYVPQGNALVVDGVTIGTTYTPENWELDTTNTDPNSLVYTDYELCDITVTNTMDDINKAMIENPEVLMDRVADESDYISSTYDWNLLSSGPLGETGYSYIIYSYKSVYGSTVYNGFAYPDNYSASANNLYADFSGLIGPYTTPQIVDVLTSLYTPHDDIQHYQGNRELAYLDHSTVVDDVTGEAVLRPSFGTPDGVAWENIDELRLIVSDSEYYTVVANVPAGESDSSVPAFDPHHDDDTTPTPIPAGDGDNGESDNPTPTDEPSGDGEEPTPTQGSIISF